MSIKSQLNNINLNKVKINGKPIKTILKEEADRLYRCIQFYIDEYYATYKPKVYDRTYRFQGAMYVENFLDIKIIGNTIQLQIKFNDDLAMHDSIYDNGVGYVPVLINDGWCWKGWENKPEDHFHKYSGYHFIEKGIDDFNRLNPYHIKINVEKIYKGKRYN